MCVHTPTLYTTLHAFMGGGGEAFIGKRKEVSDTDVSCIAGQRLLKGSQQMREVDVGTVHRPELVWAPPSCQNPQ